MPCAIVLNPWKRTPNQLIKYNFSFNKINSIIYHVLQQNFLLFAGKKKYTYFFKRRSKTFHAA